MDLTEAFAPSQAGGATGADEKTTDYFDFVVSPPPPHGDANDEDSFLHRAGCRTTINFLNEARLHDGFIKETNNNTLTALPPVSTITGSLGHIAQHNQRNRCLGADEPVPMDQSDYWVSDDAKEQTCSILLEDLNKYCWSAAAAAAASSTGDQHGGAAGLLEPRRDSPLGEHLQVQQQQSQQQQQRDAEDRQNTDGAIYTLTVLNSEANSMDGLEGCCKSPGGGAVGTGPDSWRPSNHLDLDAILNMESSVSIGADGSATGSVAGSAQEAGGAEANGMVVGGAQFGQAADEQTSFVQVKSELGDNNNDWKLSDRNSLQEGESAAESLLRNALQGKLYPAAARILASDVQQLQQQVKDEQMQPDELLLSQLDAVDSAYRTADYEKLKSIASEVVESYCNLEPAVCSVPGTTVMYTLDPQSGSLGTITLPADLAQVGTVTVVTTGPPPPEPLLQDTRHSEQQAQTATAHSQQIATSGATGGGAGGGASRASKPTKKYVRRSKANGGAAGGGANAAGNLANSSPGAASGGAGSPSGGGSGSGGATAGGTTTQRKERSLHYCSICSKGFKDKYSVNVHIRTHTGEKPFSCSLCGKSFRQKAHLAKHYQTHVTQKPSSVAAQAAQAAAAAQAHANASANGATPASPQPDQIVAAPADSQIAS